jgi:hypothetical protein
MNGIITIGAYTISADVAYRVAVLGLLTAIVVLLTSIQIWLTT